MFLGLPESGVANLAGILEQHPRYSSGTAMAHKFFSPTAHEILNEAPREDSRNVEDYLREFSVPCNISGTFDASPQTLFIGNPNLHSYYFRTAPGVLAVSQVFETLGYDMRFVVVLRDPVDMVVSLHNDHNDTLPEVNKSVYGSNNTKKLMCYADALESWLHVFPTSQFLFLDGDVIFDNTASFHSGVRRMLSFAGASFRGTDDDYYNELDVTDIKMPVAGQYHSLPMHDNFRAEYYSDPYSMDCKARLERLTGLSFAWNTTVTVPRDDDSGEPSLDENANWTETKNLEWDNFKTYAEEWASDIVRDRFTSN